MNRRRFLSSAGSGAAAAALAAPAAAQSMPSVRWRMASSFPKSLDTIFGGAESLAQRVRTLTDGRFEIRVFAAGELVPGLQVLDACQEGTIECGQTQGFYYIGKNKAFAFDSALPFGLNARQHNAWLYAGGGLDLVRALYREHECIYFPAGNTGAQMGGWYRRTVHDLAGFRGMKVRIPGIGGEIAARLGAVAQTIPGADIYPALEKGTIDAAEWVGPYDDEKLGFHRVAPHYYFPGWWEGSSCIGFVVNATEWDRLPGSYRAAFELAAAEANVRMIASYDAKNPQALARLVSQGVQLHPYPKDILVAALAAANALYDEESARNPVFAKFYASWRKFRYEQTQWYRIAEATFNNFMASQRLPTG
ncbi:MAG: ABC transporter substrate-binding protein [Burkholderiales bacterium]|nr:ABC transporter substrate-binding protein [Burkholderiales bacterium]